MKSPFSKINPHEIPILPRPTPPRRCLLKYSIPPMAYSARLQLKAPLALVNGAFAEASWDLKISRKASTPGTGEAWEVKNQD